MTQPIDTERPHELITPQTCRHRENYLEFDTPCPVCDGGLAICINCHKAESELGDDPVCRAAVHQVVPTLLESGVIKFCADRKVIRQRLHLALAWVDSELVRSCCHCRSCLVTKVLGWLGGFASVEPFCILAHG